LSSNNFEIVILGVAAALGLYAGKIARIARLPSLIGYMLLGVVLGVSGLEVLGEPTLKDLTFVTEISLGFVAFAIGSELNVRSLGRKGFGIISIIFAESFGAFFMVLAGVYLLTGDLALSLIFAAVAPASAPAGTVAVIQEYRARGSLTKTLYAVVGFDDGLAILIFGFADALARSILVEEVTGRSEDVFTLVASPAKEIALSLAVGAVMGLVFCALVKRLTNPGEVFILAAGAVLAGTGVSLVLNLSPILTNLVIGFALSNTRREEEVRRVMTPVAQFMPLLFILFFCLAGAHLDLSVLSSLGILGGVYILCRSIGLVGGSRLGALLGNVEPKVKKYVGLGILSQAGVAVGLSLIAKQQFEGIGSEHAVQIGAIIITSVTATSVVFEIAGPILTKFALQKAGEITTEDD